MDAEMERLAMGRKSVGRIAARLVLGLGCISVAGAQGVGNFVAGIDFSAGAPVLISNTNYYFGGISPVQVETGDFNNDGRLDLVVAGSCGASLPGCPRSGSVVAVYLGQGNGGFQAPLLSGFNLPSSLRSIAVGDFNGDGKLDVAAAMDSTISQDPYAGAVTILLGDGKGGLISSAQFVLNGNVLYAKTLAVGDFNADGKLDLVVGVGCYNITVNGCSVGALVIYPGDGAGKLGIPVAYGTVGNGALIPVVADFNGDGLLDVVAAGTYSPGGQQSSSLTVLMGKGDGSFLSPAIPTLPFFPAMGVVSADLNGDGKPDLAVLTTYGVQVIFGGGDGSFGTPTSYYLGHYNTSIAVADLNGDHNPDLVVSDEVTGVVALVNNGSGNGAGTFVAGAEYPLGGWASASVTVGDFNRDGKVDVVRGSTCSETSSLDNHCPDGMLGVLFGNGDGTLQGAVPLQLTATPQHVVLGDINGDGIPDMVGTENYYSGNNQRGGVIVALGLGGGQFAPATEYETTLSNQPVGIALADMNGDGNLDVVVDGYLGSAGGVNVLLGGGNGTLHTLRSYSLTGYPTGQPAVGDFAGNKKLGVAVALQSYSSGPSGVGILLGNGDGSLKQAVFTATKEIYPFGLTAADFNQDGITDVAAIGMVTLAPFNGGRDTGVTVLLGNGTGRLAVKANPDSNPANNYLYICDGQNLCAFLASYPTVGALGTFGPMVAPITTADINGDGSPDLVIANECMIGDNSCATGKLAIYYGRPDGTFNTLVGVYPGQNLTDANYLGVAVSDVNGDGKPDVVATTLNGVAVLLWPFKSGIVYATSARNDGEVPAIADLNGDGGPDIVATNGSVVEVLYNRSALAHLTATQLTSSASKVVLGSAVTFTATVTSGFGVPAGSVDFLEGSTILGTAMLSGGQAVFTTPSLGYGTHSIVAVYGGNAGYRESTSQARVVNVQGLSKAALTLAPATAVYGQMVTFAAKITSAQAAVPDGETVSFKQGNVVLGTGLTVAGVATFRTTAMGVGTDAVVAVYPGDVHLAGCVSAAQSVVIAKAAAVVSLKASANPAAQGASVTFTATVAPQFRGTPTGTVRFSAGNTVLGTITLVNGVASVTTTSLPVGVSTVTATYGGGTSFNVATASLAETVK